MTESAGDPHQDDDAATPRQRWEHGDDLDADARREAAGQIGRRATIWFVPLVLVGLLLTGLGIPWWISLAAMTVVMAVLVFEIEI